MYKIIFFDIDGTLRPFETLRVSDSTIKAIEKARNSGIICAIASGRHYLEMYNENLLGNAIFDAILSLDGEYAYTLPFVSNLNCIDEIDDYCKRHKLKKPYFHPENGELISRMEIPKKDISLILKLLKKENFSCTFLEEHRIYVNRLDPELLEILESFGGKIPEIGSPLDALLNPTYMLIPIMEYERSKKLEEELLGSHIVRWNDGKSFDITVNGVDKVYGIKKLLNYYGIKQSEIVAIGDGMNDISMLEFAGLGIAMGNANDSVKKSADYITGNSKDRGIEEAIDYILRKNLEFSSLS